MLTPTMLAIRSGSLANRALGEGAASVSKDVHRAAELGGLGGLGERQLSRGVPAH